MANPKAHSVPDLRRVADGVELKVVLVDLVRPVNRHDCLLEQLPNRPVRDLMRTSASAVEAVHQNKMCSHVCTKCFVYEMFCFAFSFTSHKSCCDCGAPRLLFVHGRLVGKANFLQVLFRVEVIGRRCSPREPTGSEGSWGAVRSCPA